MKSPVRHHVGKESNRWFSGLILVLQIVLAALVAVVAAEPFYPALGYAAGGYLPVNHLGYSAFGYSVPSVHLSGAVPAMSAIRSVPVHDSLVYTTGHRVESVYEPVEQHGYQVVY